MTLRKKVCEGIIKASAAKNSDIGTVPGQVVHVKCRSDYVNPNVVKGSITTKIDNASLQSQSVCVLRALTEKFNYKKTCLFCGKSDLSGGRRTSFRLTPVRTMDFRSRILQACDRFNIQNG